VYTHDMMPIVLVCMMTDNNNQQSDRNTSPPINCIHSWERMCDLCVYIYDMITMVLVWMVTDNNNLIQTTAST